MRLRHLLLITIALLPASAASVRAGADATRAAAIAPHRVRTSLADSAGAHWQRDLHLALRAAQLTRPQLTDSLFPLLLARLRERGLTGTRADAELRGHLVGTLMRENRYADPRALAQSETLLALQARLRGEGAPEWLAAGNARVLVLLRLRRYEEADRLANLVLDRARSSSTDGDAARATAYRQAGLAAAERGDARRARELHRQALAITTRLHGAESAAAAQDELNIAYTEIVLGNLPRADSLFAHLVPLLESGLPEHDPLVTYAIGVWGTVRIELEDRAGALRLRQQAVEREERFPGAPRPELPEMLRLLANSYLVFGDTLEAGRTIERAIALGTRIFGPEHREVLECRLMRAEIVHRSGDSGAAALELERIVADLERALGASHEWVGHANVELSYVRLDRGELALARAAVERALAGYAVALGPRHFRVSTALGLLARIESLEGRHADALRRLDAAEDALAGHPRDAHRRWSRLGAERADALARAGREAEAWRAALRADSLSFEFETLAMAGLSEREALQTVAGRPPALELALSLASNAPATLTARARGALLRDTWTALAHRRAQVLDELAARRHAAVSSGDTRVDSLRLAYRAAAEAWARSLTTESASDERAAARREQRRAAWLAAERALTRASGEFRRQSARRTVTFEQFAAGLPAGAALVAYAQVRGLDSTLRVRGPCGDRYVALLLRAGGAEPEAVPLSSIAEVDSLARNWRASVAVPPGLDRAALDEAEQRTRREGEALRRAVWDPVASRLAGVHQVFVVPEGALHLVPLGALPASAGGYVVESPQAVHALGAESDLLPRTEARATAGLLAMGDADFGGPEPGGPDVATRNGARRGGPSPCPDFATLTFPRLPASGEEVRLVERVWNASPSRARADSALALTGTMASEAALKQLAHGRRVLHLATHGFFLGAGCAANAPGRRGIGGTVAARPPAAGARPAEREPASHPLRLSGLVWANANRRAGLPPESEDGVLTAEEVSALDLGGAEWAVLSACETGAGDIAAGEGVLGLRRAFQMAGVRTVIMSLWELDDDAARDWMAALYRLRGEGRSTAEAVRGACLDVLRGRRARGASTHPFFWGAFASAGDWR